MPVRICLFIFLSLLTGCMNASWEILSAELKMVAPLKPAYKSTDIVAVRWSTQSGSVTPNYLRLEISDDNGSTWTVVESSLPNTGSYDWDISTLTQTTYKVRLTAVINQASETIDLGSFLIDDQVPVVVATQSVSVTEDTITPFTLNTPVENDQFTLKFISNPAKGTLSGCANGSNSLACVYTPNLNNDVNDSFTYKVVDRAGNESALVTVTFNLQPVNDVPVITTLACGTIASENQNYSCTIQATDVDLPSPLTLSYHFGAGTTCGAWLTIDSATGEVHGTPSKNEIGTSCDIRVYAEDDVAGQSSPFAWTLSILNSPPTINVASNSYTITEDAALAVVIPDADVTSIEEDGVNTYSLVAPTVAGDACSDHAMAPTGTNYTIDSLTGAFSFRPAADYQGTCQIRIALTDSFGATGFANVAIVVTNTQDAPVVSANLAPCSASATEDVAYTCTVPVTDPDPENLTITRGGADTCSWISITPSPNGRTVVVTGTPANNNVGTCTLAISAADAVTSDTKSLNITVSNAEPTLTIGTPVVLTEDDPIFASAPVEVLSDAAVSSLDEGFGTYSLIYTGLTGVACNDSSVVVTAATDFIIDANTGAVKIKPRADYYGTCYAKIQFDDGNGAGNSVVAQEIAVIVNPVNDAPTITSIPSAHEILLNPSGTTPSSFNISVDVGPPNENVQTVQMICTNSNPTRLTVDCSATRAGDGNLTINFIATAGVDASAVVTVKVRDSGGGTNESAVATVNVSMTDAVVLTPIAADTMNYDIHNQAASQYNSTVANSNRTFVVTVNPTVKVYSNDPTLPAMQTGSLSTGARVRLINNGMIIGAFGNGGLAPSATSGPLRQGQHGGTAFKINSIYNNVTILNNGMIYGGGGGGGRGGTNNSDSGAGGNGGAGEGPSSAAVDGTVGASSGGTGGVKATSMIAGSTPAASYNPDPMYGGIPQTQGSAGQGGSSCLIGAARGNDSAEGAFYGRGGFGAGFGGGAGACAVTYGGGGGGGYYGGGGGSGGLADSNDSGNVNTDVNGYNGGNGGAAIEVPSSVLAPADINIVITPGGGSQIAGCVWNDISGVYTTNAINNSTPNTRALTFTPISSENVNAPSGIKFWDNGRGQAYR